MPGLVGINVDGAYVVRPGVYPTIDASEMVPTRPALGGPVAIASPADGGVPGETYMFRSFAAAQAVIRGGAVLSFLSRIFRPSGSRPGASTVYWTRIGAPTQATASLAGMDFTSVDYGRHTNGISIAVASVGEAAAVAASNTLTSDGTAPADGATVTIGAKTYTFKTALTPTEGEVLIGGSAATALANLKSAINHTGVPDTDYKCAAAHPTVSAGTLTATTLAVAALTPGTAGNSIATTETSTHLSWGSATLTGGTAAVLPTWTVTIRKRIDKFTRAISVGRALEVKSTATSPKVVFDHAAKQVLQYENGTVVATLDYPSDAVTISNVAAFLSARSGWTARVKSGGDPSMPARYMDNPVLGSAVVISATDWTELQACQGQLVWKLANGGLQVTAVETATGTYDVLSEVAETYLTGGTGTANDTFVSQDWSDGLALLETVPARHLFLPSADPTVQTLGLNHCIDLAAVTRKRWRAFYTGGLPGETYEDAAAAAVTFDGPCVYAWNGTEDGNPISGLRENLGGLGTAAQICGLAAGSYSSEPLTNKQVRASSLEVANPSDEVVDTLLVAGVTPIAPDPTTGAATIVQAITTYQGGPNVMFRKLQGLLIQFDILYGWQAILSDFVGQPLDLETAEKIKARCAKFLDAITRSPQNPGGVLTKGYANGDELPAWEDLTVEGDGIDSWDIRVNAHPVGETAYIPVKTKLTPQKFSL
jgi:hypothetical protein